MKKLAALFLAVILGGCAALEPALEPPSLSLTGIRVLDVSLFEQRFVLNIRMQNPNPVELPVTGMNIQLDINEVEFGRGVSNQAVTVSAYGETVFEITLVSNVARLVDQIRTLESGKGESLRYRLAGGISVANRLSKLPFNYHGEIGQQR
jgi:LEA14-like dessication related protein